MGRMFDQLVHKSDFFLIYLCLSVVFYFVLVAWMIYNGCQTNGLNASIIDRLIGWLVEWLMTDWLIDLLIDWLADWLMDYSLMAWFVWLIYWHIALLLCLPYSYNHLCIYESRWMDGCGMIHKLTTGKIVWMNYCPTDWLIDLLIEWLIEWLIEL